MNRKSGDHERGRRGFTLVEALVTLAAIGTVALAVYPTYAGYVLETGRNDAYTALLDIATLQEHYFQSHKTYSDVLVAPAGCAGAACGLSAYDRSAGGYYALSVRAGGTDDLSTSFVLTATSLPGRRQFADEACAVLTLDSRGTMSPAECW